MNAKQTVQMAPAIAGIAAVAPEILVIAGIGCGIYFGLKWLFSEDEEKKPETPSAPAVPPRPALQPPISAGKINIPPFSAPIPAAPPAPTPLVSAPATRIPISPSSTAPVGKIQPEIPLPARNKIISREDMAKIFTGGRGLTRKSAVSALKALGYGKTAAYQALEINGRFAPWLRFALDGMITWIPNGTIDG